MTYKEKYKIFQIACRIRKEKYDYYYKYKETKRDELKRIYFREYCRRKKLLNAIEYLMNKINY